MIYDASMGALARTIPTIDLTGARDGTPGGRQRVAEEIDRACREVGFLIVAGHGVPPELIAELRAVTYRFMDLPEEVKARTPMRPESYRGWAGPGAHSLAASYGVDAPPDLKESFAMGPIGVTDDPYYWAEEAGQFFAENRWPPEVPEMEDVWVRYYRALNLLATDLMRLFAIALGADEHFFDDKVDRHLTDLVGIRYPPLDEPPAPGQLRGGPHTDFGSLTILQRDDAPGGLQVQIDGEWVDAPFVADTFVVNIGDLMAEWTNDRWLSTIHRVVPPDELAAEHTDRLSFAYFHQPNYDAVITVLPECTSPTDPPRHEPITSGEHFGRKLGAVRGPELGAAAGA
ncbi:MAG: 2OG-Fe(II) oxygenase family protein [Acidimicrobiales bacterium]|nr:2OG-Fe(II) oxygenase family protein [Acidimicrobiales bacterium]